MSKKQILSFDEDNVDLDLGLTVPILSFQELNQKKKKSTSKKTISTTTQLPPSAPTPDGFQTVADESNSNHVGEPSVVLEEPLSSIPINMPSESSTTPPATTTQPTTSITSPSPPEKLTKPLFLSRGMFKTRQQSNQSSADNVQRAQAALNKFNYSAAAGDIIIATENAIRQSAQNSSEIDDNGSGYSRDRDRSYNLASQRE